TVLSTVRERASVSSVDSSPAVTVFTVMVALPSFIVRDGSRRTFGIFVGVDPLASVRATEPCRLIEAAPADGRPRISTSTRAAAPEADDADARDGDLGRRWRGSRRRRFGRRPGGRGPTTAALRFERHWNERGGRNGRAGDPSDGERKLGTRGSDLHDLTSGNQ